MCLAILVWDAEMYQSSLFHQGLILFACSRIGNYFKTLKTITNTTTITIIKNPFSWFLKYLFLTMVLCYFKKVKGWSPLSPFFITNIILHWKNSAESFLPCVINSNVLLEIFHPPQ